VVLNLALAQRDSRRWGDDASEFKIRSLSEYIKKSVGFAEMARDDKVAEGRVNQHCPGKDLALMIGEAFFKAFNKTDWKVEGEPTAIEFAAGPSYFSAFELVRA